MTDTAANIVKTGTATLGIELGSTNIKATLVAPDHSVIASGSHTWENQFEDRLWTYSLQSIWTGIQEAVSKVRADAESKCGVRPETFAAIGISAMMHGYLPFDKDDNLLAPFRTWRNTNTGDAVELLSEELDYNIPHRWSVAHFTQAVLDNEAHVSDVAFLTTLAGYVHWKLTGKKVLGVGDASGMFPIDPTTHDYDETRLQKADKVLNSRGIKTPLRELFPTVLVAGQPAGTLTEDGAALLAPNDPLKAGIPLCPPEGDAGTGMVATNAVSPRTGNVSTGTSIFAMVVLEGELSKVHPELDMVTTPAGDLVAMVHCNNGASEIADWADLLIALTKAVGADVSTGAVYDAFLGAALDGEANAGGILAYNYLSGEPLTGLEEGRPLVVRTPGARFNLANFARAQIYSMFATLSLGMEVLHEENVKLERMYAHGGIYKTKGVAQRFLAAAVDAPVSIATTASEGGSWGMAILAQYMVSEAKTTLADYLANSVFAGVDFLVENPQSEDQNGYKNFLKEYVAGLDIQREAIKAIK
jgi:Sugar (pentulose and hexulose) kinases